tara:strand:- start:1912 stop:2322 length:411 start_codon:yes stop_codon:yes gene_type:complete
VVNQYIFDTETSEVFYEKLEELHDKYVYHLILNGVAEKGTHLESIKMTKNPQANKKYCEKVVGGLLNIKPKILIKLVQNKKTKLECILTHINDKKDFNHIYMIQNVMDWPEQDKFSCQIWYLGETSVKQIEEIWNK